MRATLGKAEKLKSRKAIDWLFREGRSQAVSGMRCIFCFCSLEDEQKEEERVRVGFTVPRKNFKKAVDRNRIKRIMREGYRKQKKFLWEPMEEAGTGCEMMLIFTAREHLSQQETEEKIILILQRMVCQLPA